MKQIEIIHTRTIFDRRISESSRFQLKETRLRYERYDGTMSDEIVRLNLERGDSAAVLIHNQAKDVLLFTEQFRYPTYEKGPGWMLEVTAGMVDEGENPAETMRRELQEEIGYQVQSLQKISTFYVSPGGTSERIHLFYASVTDSDRTGKGGGLAREGEDIRTVALSVDEAIKMVESGEICDAKTMIAVQWLQLNRAKLRGNTEA
ncbi:MAG: NUDIX hydrolase [Chloroflexi bacterium]|nr:MAG: NUDIX hydrolase [Chloroflexota bacterium]